MATLEYEDASDVQLPDLGSAALPVMQGSSREKTARKEEQKVQEERLRMFREERERKRAARAAKRAEREAAREAARAEKEAAKAEAEREAAARAEEEAAAQAGLVLFSQEDEASPEEEAPPVSAPGEPDYGQAEALPAACQDKNPGNAAGDSQS